MSLRLLLRFGDLFNPSPPGLEELPDWLRRDILGDDRAAGVPDARSAQAPAGADPARRSREPGTAGPPPAFFVPNASCIGTILSMGEIAACIFPADRR